MRALDAPEFLAGERRTILLGEAAVILHGLSRLTKDFDVWYFFLAFPLGESFFS
jgi:hypothetical protein